MTFDLRRGAVAAAVGVALAACGPALEEGPPERLASPSPALDGADCGTGAGEDALCDCGESCNYEIHLQFFCSAGARPDGSLCTAGIFNAWDRGLGVCVQGRCCSQTMSCEDGKACTLDVCVAGTDTCDRTPVCPGGANECFPGACAGDGSCASPVPYLGDGAPCSAGVCWQESCQAGCWIEGVFESAGLDPADDCRSCDVAASRTAWTPLADGASCGTGAGQFCVSNACRTGCFIDGAFHAPGAAKPGDECWICDVATPTAWTASFGPCGGDGLHCTDDRCGGDGVCHHDPVPGCVEPEEKSLYGCGSTGRGGGLLLAAGALWLLARRRRGHRAIAIALLLAALPLDAAAARRPGTGAGGAKLAVLTFKAGAGVGPQTAELVTRTLSAAIQARTGFALLTTADLMAVLDFEQQKAALGCTEEECLAEMGGALGVDWIVTGALGRIGEALAFNAQLVDIRTGVALRRFATTVRAGSDEAFLDLVAPAVDALFPDARPPPRFALSVRGEAELRSPLGGGGAILLEARIGGALRAGGGLLATPHHVGALGRVSWLPWRALAALHPVLSLELTVLGGDGAAFGVGLSPGLEWAPRRELALLLELPLQWFPAAPEQTRAGYALAAASAAWRF